MTLTTAPASAQRIPGLDIMRATAVMMVLVCHWAGHFGPWMGRHVPEFMEDIGETGVALFFVLSGFLIGRILLDIGDRKPGWAAFRGFMARRLMRTMPLYFLVLALMLTLFPPRENAVSEGLRFATMTQNLIQPMPSDFYFPVTWSLAIEEWFYLLFGAAFIAAARWLGGTGAIRLCLPVFLVVPLAARAALGDPPPMVPFRLDMIAYGVVVAVAWRQGSRVLRHPRLCLSAGLGLVGLSLTHWLPPALDPSLLVAGCALCLPMALAARPGGSRLTGVAQWVAARSYGLYLIHLTLISNVIEDQLWAPGRLPLVACVALALGGPFLLADLSYRFLERPLLAGRATPLGRKAGAAMAFAGSGPAEQARDHAVPARERADTSRRPLHAPQAGPAPVAMA